MSRKILIGSFVLSLFFNVALFVFAYVQKVAADEARMQAMQNEKHAIDNEMKAQQAQAEAERQVQRAIVCMHELEKTRK
jgi:hypothetical protein